MENPSADSIMERMAKRDRDRKDVIEKQKASKDKSKLEGVDYFDSIFDTKISEINSRLETLQPGDDITTMQNELTAVLKELQDLQKYFTSSTLFLNDRKIQNCQDVINQLIARIDESRARLVPKKKFGFKNKSNAPSQMKSETKIDGVVKEPAKEYEWTDAGRKNQVIEISSDQTNTKDLTFKDMENCVIIIKGHAGSVQMSKIKNCLLLTGPIARSMFADDCENCTFSVTCQQLRLHSSKSCKIYLHVTSRAIIEDCSEILFAPTSYTYDGYGEDMEKSGLNVNVNNWEDIGDFNCLSADEQSPNWNRIDEHDRISDWQELIEKFKLHAIN